MQKFMKSPGLVVQKGGGSTYVYNQRCVAMVMQPTDPHCPWLKTKYDRSWGLISMGIAICIYGARTGMGGI
jgi:hypothetical protein